MIFIKKNGLRQDSTHGLNAALETGSVDAPANEYEPYRQLASAVIRQAVDDVLGRGPVLRPDEGAPLELVAARELARADALGFLFAGERGRSRGFWLAWLGMSEGALWALLAKPRYQGLPNQLLPIVRRYLEGVAHAH